MIFHYVSIPYFLYPFIFINYRVGSWKDNLGKLAYKDTNNPISSFEQGKKTPVLKLQDNVLGIIA